MLAINDFEHRGAFFIGVSPAIGVAAVVEGHAEFLQISSMQDLVCGRGSWMISTQNTM